MRYKEHIDTKEIQELPAFSYGGEVIVIEEAKKIEGAVRYLAAHTCLGFDTETRPAFHKGETHPVSLLQLATPEKVYLFRLNKCGFPLTLRNLLAEKRIEKIGVGIRDDIRALRKLGNFQPVSFIDLQEFVAHYGIGEKSFSKLMAIIFQVKISKRQRVTNWDAPVLTLSQIKYAATDAWGALRMYEELKNQ